MSPIVGPIVSMTVSPIVSPIVSSIVSPIVSPIVSLIVSPVVSLIVSPLWVDYESPPHNLLIAHRAVLSVHIQILRSIGLRGGRSIKNLLFCQIDYSLNPFMG